MPIAGILHALVQKIEHRKNPASRFHFEEGLSYEEKFNLVSEWWNDFRFHLAMNDTSTKSPTIHQSTTGHSFQKSSGRKKGWFTSPE